MEKPLISVIIPAFNSEKTIGKLISIFSNAEQLNLPFELLLIDDGSTDKTAQIVKETFKDHPEFHYFYQKNGGTSSARNLGIEKSKAEYLLFIDSDDTISLAAFKKLFEMNIPNDGLLLSIKKISGGLAEKKCKFTKIELVNKLPFFKALSKMPKVLDSSCNVLYKKDIIEKEILRFEIGRTCEDTLFNLDYFKCIKDIQYLPDEYYFYSMDNLDSRSKKSHAKELCDSMLFYFKKCTDCIKKNDEYSNVCINNITNYFPIIIGYSYFLDKKDSIQTINELKKYRSYFRGLSSRTILTKLLLIFGYRFASKILSSKIS